MTGKKQRSGGPRPGSGRPRQRILWHPPDTVLADLEAIAQSDGVEFNEVVKAAIVRYIAWRKYRELE